MQHLTSHSTAFLHFSLGDGVDNPTADEIERCGGLDRIEQLQEHPIAKIYDKAGDMLRTYFAMDRDDIDPSAGVSDGQFMFNPTGGLHPPGGFNL